MLFRSPDPDSLIDLESESESLEPRRMEYSNLHFGDSVVVRVPESYPLSNLESIPTISESLSAEDRSR